MTMKMTMAEFVGPEPCPFCGGEAETWDGAGPWHVVCTECGTIGPPCLSEAEAIAAWNSRAERTCKHDRMFNLVKRECDGKRYSWRDMDMPNYCPNCGCKVVS